jgi:lipid-A-disaccharide synthase
MKCTTTLEAGLMQFPGVICYKTSALTYQIAKRFVKLLNIGLVNIVLGKTLYPEFIQDEFTVNNIVKGLGEVDSNRSEFTASLSSLRDNLRSRGDGTPSERVASYLLHG